VVVLINAVPLLILILCLLIQGVLRVRADRAGPTDTLPVLISVNILSLVEEIVIAFVTQGVFLLILRALPVI
jgi:hypothetical protein